MFANQWARISALALFVAPIIALAGVVQAPTQVRLRPAEGFVQVALGSGHACAITQAGGVACWGNNDDEQLGDGGSTDQPHPVPVAGLGGTATQLVAGRAHTCALIAGGSVQCWGDNLESQLADPNVFPGSSAPVDVPGLAAPAVQLASGADHVCARLQGGAVQCWGAGASGQVGAGSTGEFDAPQTVSLPGAANDLAAGARHTCAVLVDGAVYCWGENTYGQLGDDSTTQRTAPVRATLLPGAAFAVAAGSQHTCAAMTAGGVRCWGDNGFNQHGLGVLYSIEQAAPVQGLPAAAVAAIRAQGLSTCSIDVQGGAYCWGFGGPKFGRGETRSLLQAARVPFDGAVSSLSIGDWALCLVGDEHRVHCAGSPADDQLGIAAPVQRHEARPVKLARPAVQLVVGQESCALDAAGVAQCWGPNENGAVGDGTRRVRTTPVDIAGRYSRLRSGDGLNCGVTLPGAAARCWGYPPSFQGREDALLLAPSPLAGLDANVADVGGEPSSACVRRTDGALQCWGGNFTGQLGRGTAESVIDETPANVVGLAAGVTDFATGGFFNCAVQDGAVKCWGENGSRQLGNDSGAPLHASPVTALLPRPALQVSITGSQGVCALDDLGDVYCWGWDQAAWISGGPNGALLALPTRLPGLAKPATRIAMGGSFGCAVLTDGTVHCWGQNYSGELGRETVSGAANAPAAVPGLQDVVDIGASGFHACALRADGRAFCWGDAGFGVLGDGSVDTSVLNAVSEIDPDHVFEAGFEEE